MLHLTFLHGHWVPFAFFSAIMLALILVWNVVKCWPEIKQKGEL